MEATTATWAIALIGHGLISLLTAVQLVAVVRPRAHWTIDNVYGGSPDDTDPNAYIAFNRASAWADPFLWAPLQIVGSIGMLRDLDFRRNTAAYWIVTWGMWPVFGVVEAVYCFVRLVQ